MTSMCGRTTRIPTITRLRLIPARRCSIQIFRDHLRSPSSICAEGARIGGLDVSLFANNVLNNHPLLSLGHDTVGDVNYRSTTFRPLTVGITATFGK